MKEPFIKHEGQLYVSTDMFKHSCDHCSKVVDIENWTFKKGQCVVCENQECKDKQKKILRDAMDKGVNDIIEGMLNNEK